MILNNNHNKLWKVNQKISNLKIKLVIFQSIKISKLTIKFKIYRIAYNKNLQSVLINNNKI